MNKNKLKSLGLYESSLLKTELSLGCANDTDAGIMGAFWGKVVHKANGNNTVVRVLFYLLRKGGCLLSRINSPSGLPPRANWWWLAIQGINNWMENVIWIILFLSKNLEF